MTPPIPPRRTHYPSTGGVGCASFHRKYPTSCAIARRSPAIAFIMTTGIGVLGRSRAMPSLIPTPARSPGSSPRRFSSHRAHASNWRFVSSGESMPSMTSFRHGLHQGRYSMKGFSLAGSRAKAGHSIPSDSPSMRFAPFSKARCAVPLLTPSALTHFPFGPRGSTVSGTSITASVLLQPATAHHPVHSEPLRLCPRSQSASL